MASNSGSTPGCLIGLLIWTIVALLLVGVIIRLAYWVIP